MPLDHSSADRVFNYIHLSFCPKLFLCVLVRITIGSLSSSHPHMSIHYNLWLVRQYPYYFVTIRPQTLVTCTQHVFNCWGSLCSACASLFSVLAFLFSITAATSVPSLMDTTCVWYAPKHLAKDPGKQ